MTEEQFQALEAWVQMETTVQALVAAGPYGYRGTFDEIRKRLRDAAHAALVDPKAETS